MATDSTELTFVRCPSCRSLVPAVSTRCRMCGATLDAAAATDEGDKEKRSGRVRQRTMSAPDSELSSTANQVREEVPPPPPPPAPEKSAPAIEGADDDDPLGDYLDAIDEVPAAKPSPAPAAMKPMAAPPPPPPPPQRSAPPPQRTAPPPVETRPAPSADIDLDEELDLEPETAAETSDRPKVIVESGGRRSFGQGKPGGLSFSRPREEQKPAARPTPPPPPQQPKAPPVAERSEPVQREAQPKRPESRPEPRREERREERPREMSSQPPPAPRQAPPPQRAVEPPRRAEATSGRLYGWLVSYADPDGKSIELREGKFFVTGSSLKESDLIINDKSISTPHALVSVGGDGGLRLQDLMSDRGVFLRHGESGAYQRREEPCTVEHGDWVRFGDVEFLVCLIAHVGVR